MAQGQENPGTLARSLISMMRPVNWMKGVISTEKDDNEHVVDNMKPCPTQCFHHSDIEDVANDNFSVMSSLFSGAFDHILDMIFQCLDGNSLATAAAVSPEWKWYLERVMWSRAEWSTHLPQFHIKFHRAKIISMRCDATNIACGERGTGRVAVYSRREIAGRRYSHLEHELGAGIDKETFDAVRPRYTLKAHAGSVNALDMNEHFLVSGSVCGSAKVWDVRDGSYVTSLLKGGSRVNAIRIVGKRHIFVGSGFQLRIYRIDGKLSEGETTFHYDGILSGHEGDILCIDHNGGELVATGSTDRTVKVWYGMARVRSMKMTLTGHTNKVKCVAMTRSLLASGGWDRSCRIWSLATGECVRVIKHEVFVRSVAMDDHRVVTGDLYGFVFVWSLANCLNSARGPDALCLRAHNAIDSDRPMADVHRWVFHVHLEKAVLIAVAGENGRITIQDFWHHGGKDVLQLESYGQDGERSKS